MNKLGGLGFEGAGLWTGLAYINHSTFFMFQIRQCADTRVFLAAESSCLLKDQASLGPGLCSVREMLLHSAVRQVRNKHHAASAVITVINQNYPPSRGWARACNDCNAGLITGLQWEAQWEANNDNETSSILWAAALVIYFSGTFLKCDWYYQSTGDMAAIHQSPVKRKSPIFHFLSPQPHNKEHCQYSFSAPAPLALHQDVLGGEQSNKIKIQKDLGKGLKTMNKIYFALNCHIQYYTTIS